MGSQDLEILIDKSLAGQCTQWEQRIVDEWYNSFDSKPGFTDLFSEGDIDRIREAQWRKMRNTWSLGDGRLFLVLV